MCDNWNFALLLRVREGLEESIGGRDVLCTLFHVAR